MVSTVEKKLDLGTLCRLCGAHQLESGLGERPTNERPFESGPFEFVRARASEYVQFRVNRRSERTCPPTLSLSLSLSLSLRLCVPSIRRYATTERRPFPAFVPRVLAPSCCLANLLSAAAVSWKIVAQLMTAEC